MLFYSKHLECRCYDKCFFLNIYLYTDIKYSMPYMIIIILQVFLTIIMTYFYSTTVVYRSEHEMSSNIQILQMMYGSNIAL